VQAEKDSSSVREKCLAISGGAPVRTELLPIEFPGVHYMDDQEAQAVVRVLHSGSLFRYYGPDLQNEASEFEKEFAHFVGSPYAVAVSSGTGALHTALSALRVGPGQEVIIPAYLFASVISAVVNHGAIPVIADIDSTFGLNPLAVEQHINERTTGIVITHMSGAASNVKVIRELARKRGLFLLEDCAQCLGGSVEGQKVGTYGDIGIFSFQPNKNMTAGEGGCLVTSNSGLYERAVACHDLGYPRDSNGRPICDVRSAELCWGMGYRLDELRAAVLRVQLRKLQHVIEAMHRSKYRIRAELERMTGVQLRTIVDPSGDTGAFLITIYPDARIAREVSSALRAEGIQSRSQASNIVMTDWGLHIYYNNVNLLAQVGIDCLGFPWTYPGNSGEKNYSKGACPTADDLFTRSIILPVPSCLTAKDEDDIIEAYHKVLGTLL